jgi:uncharacterized protein (TIGR02117 family)
MKYLFVIYLFLGTLLNGCASIPSAKDIPVANTQHTVYFIYRGWHTSILLDAKALVASVPKLESDLKNQKYVRVGWGDGDYFTGKDKSFTSATKALVASGYSALQLLPYDYEPFAEIPAESIVPIAITDKGLRDLTNYIGNSAKVDVQGQLVRLPVFGDATGFFLQAKDSYGVFSNCNTWSANALRAAGLPIANRLTAQGVFRQAKFISKIQSEHNLFKKHQ